MNEIIAAMIALIGTALGTFGGMVTSARLTSFRLAALEKQVERLCEKTQQTDVIAQRVHDMSKRIAELEQVII